MISDDTSAGFISSNINMNPVTTLMTSQTHAGFIPSNREVLAGRLIRTEHFAIPSRSIPPLLVAPQVVLSGGQQLTLQHVRQTVEAGAGLYAAVSDVSFNRYCVAVRYGSRPFGAQ
jgi:hypothetical protein